MSSLTPPVASRRTGRREFVLVVGVMTALGALSIDTVLPAFPEIRAYLGLDPDSKRLAFLVSVYLLGLGVGQLPLGILSDRYGRRPVLVGGLAVFVAAGIAASLAPTLAWMIFARFVWGIGAAAPRAVSMAMVRDSFEGVEMSTVLSYTQSIFVLAPIFAPSLGSLVLSLTNWQGALLVPVIAAAIVILWMSRIRETLAVENRRVISAQMIMGAFRQVFAVRISMAYTLGLVFVFGMVSGYIAIAELIIKDTYDRAGQFPLIFGCIAAVMGVATLTNAQLVRRFGLPTMLKFGTRVLAVVAVLFGVVNVGWNGHPPFLMFCFGIAAILALVMLVMPNYFSAALEPLGHIAGVASGLIGTVSTIGGAVLGGIVT